MGRIAFRHIGKIALRYVIIAAIVPLLLNGLRLSAQNVNVEDFTKWKDRKIFKFGGSVSATGTYYNANEMFGRQPFTWQLNGSLNLSLFELIDIPLSFNFNNFGSQFTYPSLPNRFSFHPSYKWIRLHVGDVAMSFSPYTLNGHQFTGGGVELTPGKWQIAAMGGRLMRRVDYNPELPSLPPSYARWGGGAKIRYNGERYFAGASLFMAKDSGKKTSFQADSLGIFPKSNVTASVEGGVTIVSSLRLSAEYGLSYLVRDSRPVVDSEKTGTGKRGGATHYYHAIKAALEYTFLKNAIALGYERIDPEYETLGAYYFNNDYENYTLSYARPLFGGKGKESAKWGVVKGGAEGSYTPAQSLMNAYDSYIDIRGRDQQFFHSFVAYDKGGRTIIQTFAPQSYWWFDREALFGGGSAGHEDSDAAQRSGTAGSGNSGSGRGNGTAGHGNSGSGHENAGIDRENAANNRNDNAGNGGTASTSNHRNGGTAATSVASNTGNGTTATGTSSAPNPGNWGAATVSAATNTGNGNIASISSASNPGNGGNGTAGRNASIYRYAEVLLIAAEAIAMSEGVTSRAADYLTDVRSRACSGIDCGTIHSELMSLSRDQFIEEVWAERLREFPFEMKIWPDIQRTRKYPVTTPANTNTTANTPGNTATAATLANATADPGRITFRDVIGTPNPSGITFSERHMLLPMPKK